MTKLLGKMAWSIVVSAVGGAIGSYVISCYIRRLDNQETAKWLEREGEHFERFWQDYA